MRATSSCARATATSSCSYRASARSATPWKPSRITWDRACATSVTLRPSSCSPCIRGSQGPSNTAYSPRTRPGASCLPPTSPRPRSPCLACTTSSILAPRGSRATRRPRRSSACRSSRSPRRARGNARAVRGASRMASRSGSTRRTTSTAGPRSRSPRSYAPRSPPCCST